MRKFILLLVVFASSVASAQLLNVGSIEKVNLPAGTVAAMSKLSHEGSFVIINDAAGLWSSSNHLSEASYVTKH